MGKSESNRALDFLSRSVPDVEVASLSATFRSAQICRIPGPQLRNLIDKQGFPPGRHAGPSDTRAWDLEKSEIEPWRARAARSPGRPRAARRRLGEAGRAKPRPPRQSQTPNRKTPAQRPAFAFHRGRQVRAVQALETNGRLRFDPERLHLNSNQVRSSA